MTGGAADHDRRPVLLVHGWSDTPRQLAHAERFLHDAGWPAERVLPLGFRDRHGCNVEHADEVAAAVERLRERTGAERVHVVAHSMGGLAVRHFLQHGADAVHTAVLAGTPNSGTWLAWLAWGRGAPQMRPGSPFLTALAASPPPPGVRIVCLRTPFDLRIFPGRSAWLDGAECLTVRARRHQSLLRHPPTLERIRALLML